MLSLGYKMCLVMSENVAIPWYIPGVLLSYLLHSGYLIQCQLNVFPICWIVLRQCFFEVREL